MARLTRSNRGAENFGACTGAHTRAGLGQRETPASLVPLTVVNLLIHSQNGSRKGGREERLEKERMEEEREEGSVGRGLQERPPGSLEMPQPSARLAALHAAPTRLGEPAGSAGLSKRHRWSPARPGPSGSPPLREGWPVGQARAHRAAGCPRSGAQQARGGSMPLLPLLAAAPLFTVRRCCRALRLTSAGPAEQPLSTERAPAGRSALLRPWGRESWEEWEGSPEGCEEHPLPGSAGGGPTRPARGGTQGPEWTRLLLFGKTRSLCTLRNCGSPTEAESRVPPRSARDQLPREEGFIVLNLEPEAQLTSV